MVKQRFKPEEIILKLREVEIGQGKGQDTATACRNAGISDVTYYRWRKEYSGMKMDQAKKFKELEQENGYIESFNGKLRNELLNGEIFDTLQKAQILIERWRGHYNTVRPHSSLGYWPPAPETTAPRWFNQSPLQQKSWYN